MKNNLTKNSTNAIGLILVGTFFFLHNFGFLESYQQFLDWRLMFILFTVLAVFKGELSGILIFGALSLCFYGFFPILTFWPLILVAIGIKKIMHANTAVA
jgi:hypothetical protein